LLSLGSGLALALGPQRTRDRPRSPHYSRTLRVRSHALVALGWVGATGFDTAQTVVLGARGIDMLRRRQFTLVLAMTVAAGWGIRAQQPDQTADAPAPRMAFADFKKLHAQGRLLVVDVRDEVSFKSGHIPGAISVPLEDVKRRAAQIRTKAADREVVTYCSCPSEHTSAEAVLALLKAGVTHASALVGGYAEWVASGGEIERMRQ
jgi:rhodanese-related sulfurtransferase